MSITYINGREVRVFSHKEIVSAVKNIFIEANYFLPDAVSTIIHDCAERETNSLAVSVLNTICDNTNSAKELSVPICQDTGMAVLFAEIGSDVFLDCDFIEAVNEGVASAYTDGYLRKSIVRDPLYHRENTGDNTPALVHISYINKTAANKTIKLTAAPKGFGSENMSAIRMFTPSATEEDIVSFVVDTVNTAGSNPCPPIFVGVGIGSDFEGCALLAKRALLRETPSEDENYKKLEEKVLNEINKLNIGPQGFGGDTTALGVYIETAPTHIAGLPVAVNINCHVARHKTIILS
ncbi:MAG: fumarate hydratase [Clostridia bacterium]|nr:fumarate hydratase [Clostridia bacterium]